MFEYLFMGNEFLFFHRMWVLWMHYSDIIFVSKNLNYSKHMCKKAFPDGKGFLIYLYISLLESRLRVFPLLEEEFSVSHR